ncbi:MAG: alcohol dehydrogenase catalytic domain-containing protein [Planctomycetota bacterium]|nr:alcohol dehydrogenase catalytic domain-containing protein [Planctomycetota bacterium]
MKAVRLTGPRSLAYADVPEPVPSPGEALVRVKAAGVCFTDVEMFRGTQPYFAMGLAHYPLTLGHEWSGEVAAVGAGVEDFRPGDRVTGDVSLGCARCRFCLAGQYNLCVVKQEVGLCRGKDGAFAEYLTMPARHLYRLPDALSYEEGAGVEPAATCVKGIHKAGLRAGDAVLVAGDGTIGLLGVQAARAAGAGLVIATGTDERKLALSRQLGADRVVDVRREKAAEAAREATGGYGVDLAIECSGRIPALRDCIQAARMGGTICVLGVYEKAFPDFPAAEIVVRDLTLVGSVASPNAFVETLRFMEQGRIRVAPLVTHTLPLAEAARAFELMEDPASGRIKILLQP